MILHPIFVSFLFFGTLLGWFSHDSVSSFYSMTTLKFECKLVPPWDEIHTDRHPIVARQLLERFHLYTLQLVKVSQKSCLGVANSHFQEMLYLAWLHEDSVCFLITLDHDFNPATP